MVEKPIMDLTLIADEVWQAATEYDARFQDATEVEVRDAYRDARNYLNTALGFINRAVSALEKVGE